MMACACGCARAENRCCSCGRYLVLSRVFANRSRPTHQAAGRQQRDVTQSVAFRLRSKSPARTLPLYSRPMDRFPPIISNRLDGKSLLKMYTAIDRGMYLTRQKQLRTGLRQTKDAVTSKTKSKTKACRLQRLSLIGQKSNFQ